MLEVLPKAVYFKRHAEEQFYRDYFRSVRQWARDADRLISLASGFSQQLAWRQWTHYTSRPR